MTKATLLATHQRLFGQLNLLRDTLAELAAQLVELPDDPAPLPEVPADFRVIDTYGGTDSPLSIRLGWTPIDNQFQTELEYRGAEGNPAGPTDWTPIPFSLIAGLNGEFATHVLQNPDGQALTFRLTDRNFDGKTASVTLAFPVISNEDNE